MSVSRLRRWLGLAALLSTVLLSTAPLSTAGAQSPLLPTVHLGSQPLRPGLGAHRLPPGVLIHRVLPGETLDRVAREAGLSITDLVSANLDRQSLDDLGVGDDLLLPGLQAGGHLQELLARRARAQENERRRQAQQARYDRQARYEAWLAAREKLAAAQQASHANPGLLAGKGGTLRTPTGVIRRAAYTGSPLIWPAHHFRLTSRFGERDTEFHREVFHGGIDLAAPGGTPIYAAGDGEVSQSGYGDYGLGVWTISGNATIIYGHMSRAAVRAGQQVRRGDLLGFVGCTGFCTGPHLHFEIRIGGTPVDPTGLLQ